MACWRQSHCENRRSSCWKKRRDSKTEVLVIKLDWERGHWWIKVRVNIQNQTSGSTNWDCSCESFFFFFRDVITPVLVITWALDSGWFPGNIEPSPKYLLLFFVSLHFIHVHVLKSLEEWEIRHHHLYIFWKSWFSSKVKGVNPISLLPELNCIIINADLLLWAG